MSFLNFLLSSLFPAPSSPTNLPSHEPGVQTVSTDDATPQRNGTGIRRKHRHRRPRHTAENGEEGGAEDSDRAIRKRKSRQRGGSSNVERDGTSPDGNEDTAHDDADANGHVNGRRHRHTRKHGRQRTERETEQLHLRTDEPSPNRDTDSTTTILVSRAPPPSTATSTSVSAPTSPTSHVPENTLPPLYPPTPAHPRPPLPLLISTRPDGSAPTTASTSPTSLLPPPSPSSVPPPPHPTPVGSPMTTYPVGPRLAIAARRAIGERADGHVSGDGGSSADGLDLGERSAGPASTQGEEVNERTSLEDDGLNTVAVVEGIPRIEYTQDEENMSHTERDEPKSPALARDHTVEAAANDPTPESPEDMNQPLPTPSQETLLLLATLHRSTRHQSLLSARVHRNITCDGCHMSPIRGIRYMCGVCPSYDLCGMCEARGDQGDGPPPGDRGGHTRLHPMMKLRIPIPPLANPRFSGPGTIAVGRGHRGSSSNSTRSGTPSGAAASLSGGNAVLPDYGEGCAGLYLQRDFCQGSAKLAWDELADVGGKEWCQLSAPELEHLYDTFRSLAIPNDATPLPEPPPNVNPRSTHLDLPASPPFSIPPQMFYACLGPLGIGRNVIAEVCWKWWDADGDGRIGWGEWIRGVCGWCEKEELGRAWREQFAFHVYSLAEPHITRASLTAVLRAHFSLSSQLVSDMVREAERTGGESVDPPPPTLPPPPRPSTTPLPPLTPPPPPPATLPNTAASTSSPLRRRSAMRLPPPLNLAVKVPTDAVQRALSLPAAGEVLATPATAQPPPSAQVLYSPGLTSPGSLAPLMGHLSGAAIEAVVEGVFREVASDGIGREEWGEAVEVANEKGWDLIGWVESFGGVY
ncbi:hypothetical protein M427DRAFT_141965 [Gonapodya prolifera JEL478]|uniref:ZZ-type domain-containing protein n=1 Tax=Gonapodya prolifera (strain JEL478) TaxID=1344416 RepID=A0A139B0R3_GONPJ|nr:hypothetical protein M427DRAFT_141965 [Gonapodya prolifera JEL478]|eukprot:KXS22557.1 hypothetical protein M427DRAFT_141965 [Gonapodya prolifera JEL478]